jgi:CRISPR-associated exonuclease Cas4
MIVHILIVALLSIVLLLLFVISAKRLYVPDGHVFYSDATEVPGRILYARSMPLVGKPDFILKKGNTLIPVEIKRGRTPSSPYSNHILQLYAYCILINDTYHTRPKYGVIRYPDKEFTVQFPDSVEKTITDLVNEMLIEKQRGFSRADLRNVCKNCLLHRELC